MLDWTTCSAVERHPQKVGGAWTFRGTRVPVSALFTNLESGATVDEFLEWFPGVSREQVNLVLEHAGPELAAFRRWLTEFDAAGWDRQIEEDVAAGRLSALAEEALADLRKGRCTER